MYLIPWYTYTFQTVEPIVEKPVPPRIDSLIPTPPVRTKASATATTAEPNEEKENKAPSGTTPKPSKVPHVFMSPPRYPSLMIIADEFSSQGSDRDYQTAVTEDNLDSGIKDGTYYARPLESVPTVGRCKALYDYEANMYDELTIRTGQLNFVLGVAGIFFVVMIWNMYGRVVHILLREIQISFKWKTLIEMVHYS